jgi:hypothetical protein
MRIFNALLSLAVATAAAGLADTVTLRSGRVVNGTYLGGSSRQVRMEVGDRIESFEISDVTKIEFGTAAAPAQSEERPMLRRAPSAILRPDPVETAAASAPAGPLNIQLPAGTNFVVRMIDGVDSERNRVGQTFQASLDEPVIMDGNTVIERGTDAVVKLVDDKQSGKLAGRTVLTLDLVSLKINGRMVDINTQSVQQASESRTGRTGKVVGGTAALGAVIGAIAGGGKGAAVGAASGAAVGAGAQVITKGQQVKIPSETRLTFTLDTTVRI